MECSSFVSFSTGEGFGKEINIFFFDGSSESHASDCSDPVVKMKHYLIDCLVRISKNYHVRLIFQYQNSIHNGLIGRTWTAETNKINKSTINIKLRGHNILNSDSTGLYMVSPFNQTWAIYKFTLKGSIIYSSIKNVWWP